jgi:hypothetical protein
MHFFRTCIISHEGGWWPLPVDHILTVEIPCCMSTMPLIKYGIANVVVKIKAVEI